VGMLTLAGAALTEKRTHKRGVTKPSIPYWILFFLLDVSLDFFEAICVSPIIPGPSSKSRHKISRSRYTDVGCLRCSSIGPRWRSPVVCSLFQVSTARDEIGERLGVIQKNAFVGHFLVVRFKRFEAVSIGD